MSAHRTALALALAVVAGGEARAEDPPAEDGPVAAAMQCERAAAAGRVKCSVEARAAGGRSMPWADVVLVELPDLAAPLKGRLAPSDVVARDEAGHTWAFALVARGPGEGDVVAHVRGAVCEPVKRPGEVPRCAPFTRRIRARIVVG